eukprot:CAMPEP_0180044396 /NCGR_PEP_ID=MMETSP0984-20121128/35904_1 /TAXON_ID=483367 /ORGANISM="non described non described, Strain CCMP 2436" /LENGTH=111 /DNA_ID=CAMNT_0021972567 /DNA_START=527 /DNA_END=860 /DNA_ORIENTATION=-
MSPPDVLGAPAPLPPTPDAAAFESDNSSSVERLRASTSSERALTSSAKFGPTEWEERLPVCVTDALCEQPAHDLVDCGVGGGAHQHSARGIASYSATGSVQHAAQPVQRVE